MHSNIVTPQLYELGYVTVSEVILQGRAKEYLSSTTARRVSRHIALHVSNEHGLNFTPLHIVY